MDIQQVSYYCGIATIIIVNLTWFGFAPALMRMKSQGDAAPDAKKAPKSWLGVIMQGIAFGLVWAVQRQPMFSPMIEGQYVLALIMDVAAVTIGIFSGWLATSAIRELGKQWSFQARLIEGHKLITTGVYGIVRHPIYTAMFGMLVATGIAVSHWLGLIAAIVVFYIGTMIRTRTEEGLLEVRFGVAAADFVDRLDEVPRTRMAVAVALLIGAHDAFHGV